MRQLPGCREMDNAIDREGRRFAAVILRKVGRAVNTWGMAGEGDTIAVALSGGTDSMVLLEALASRRRRLPISYGVIAVHVKVAEVGYGLDREYAEDFCRSLEVPFHCLTIGMDAGAERGGSPCFLCARLRRKALFDFMAEQRCTRLALGHHRDDAVETLLMNMVFQGNISTMPPRLSMFGGEFDIIRPLVLLGKEEVERYATLRGLRAAAVKCPFGDDTRRNDIRRLLGEMEKLYPGARRNLFRSMGNIRKDYLQGG